MKCKLTGIEGRSVKAHIIPKSFFPIDPGERRPNKIVTNTRGQYPRRSPNGIYDSTIVTEEGERFFSPWDDYAAELLLDKRNDFTDLLNNGECVAYQINDYDYVKLKLFFLSVLWRASVSEHAFFKKVNLGSHENIIRDALLQGKAGDSDWYAVSLATWSDHPGGMGIMDPFREKYFGINYYRLYLEGYIAYIKVDKRNAEEPLRSIQMTSDSPLIIVARELSNSKEMPVMRNVVKDAYK